MLLKTQPNVLCTCTKCFKRSAWCKSLLRSCVVATQYQMSASMLGAKAMALGASLRELCANKDSAGLK